MSEEHPRADLRGPCGERVLVTQSVNREFFGLDRFSLVSPSYPGLETIRNQTLHRAITDYRVSPQGGSALSACFGGFAEVYRRSVCRRGADIRGEH